MGTKWGCRIAESSNDKGCRTNYRYMRNSVIVSVSFNLRIVNPSMCYIYPIVFNEAVIHLLGYILLLVY